MPGVEGKSESRILKSRGLSGDPCGTPLVIGYDREKVLPITREKDLSDRKDWNHWSGGPKSPRRASFTIMALWDAVSNAPLRSRKATSVNCLWLYPSCIRFSSRSRASKVLRWGRKPNMLGGRMCLRSINQASLFLMMCSRILLGLHMRLMGL